jgi:hypothetical protein
MPWSNVFGAMASASARDGRPPSLARGVHRGGATYDGIAKLSELEQSFAERRHGSKFTQYFARTSPAGFVTGTRFTCRAREHNPVCPS